MPAKTARKGHAAGTNPIPQSKEPHFGYRGASQSRKNRLDRLWTEMSCTSRQAWKETRAPQPIRCGDFPVALGWYLTGWYPRGGTWYIPVSSHIRLQRYLVHPVIQQEEDMHQEEQESVPGTTTGTRYAPRYAPLSTASVRGKASSRQRCPHPPPGQTHRNLPSYRQSTRNESE